MDLIKVIKTRRSIRVYNNKPISKKELELLVDCARFAPTARNVQPWHFVIVTDKEKLSTIATLLENARFIKDASCCIFVLCEDTKYYLEDGCAATQNILLAATSLGIGSCWVAGDKKSYTEEIKRILAVPKDYKLVSIIALGYPKEENAFYIADKKRLEEIIHWEVF